MNAIPERHELNGTPRYGSSAVPCPVPGAHEREPSDEALRARRAERLVVRQAGVLALIAELLDEPTLQSALDGFAGALQQRFGATRAVLALVDGNDVLGVGAIAQRTHFDAGSTEVRLLLDAMEEAAALECTVCYPTDDASPGAFTAHRALLAARTGTCVVSVPLYRGEALVGALLLERDDGRVFKPVTIDLLERVALVTAPLLAIRCEAERGAGERLRRDLRTVLERRLGAERLGARLALGIALTAVMLGLLVPVQRDVRAATELVPRERRLVTAPVAGFVDEVLVAAGERVVPGQLLARLDRRELELEAAREEGEWASAAADLRAAMANHDRQASAIAQARLEQERAQRALIEHRFERGELRAPIAGLIASGNPLDAVGAPVTRGDTLFEIVPGDGYEAHLLVDAADIRDVREGQMGQLKLEGRSGEPLAFTVRTIHPVAESGDGMNRFRVRADLVADEAHLLHPGERGLARLAVGNTSVLGWLASPILERLAELRWRFLG